MWANRTSIKKAASRALSFAPPYCANPGCLWHQRSYIDRPSPFLRHGAKKIDRYPYVNPRFRCRRCRRTFSASFFTLQYRDRHDALYEQVHDLMLGGYSLRAIARQLGTTEDAIRRKKKKLARWALLRWAQDVGRLPIREPLAYDGLENFSFSQYDPNNLNHAVGRASLYVYDFNLAPMNRKGALNDWQKVHNAELEKRHGRYPSNAIETSSARLFARLLARSPGALDLHTDRHPAYARAIRRLTDSSRIRHTTTSSKINRNFHNKLFPINHSDLLSRHQLGTFRRETIAFAKNSVAMLESFVLLAVNKNYLRPQFWKPHVKRPEAHRSSPAMDLGLRDKIISFAEFYRERITAHQVALSSDWNLLFSSSDPYARRLIRPYKGI